MTDSPPATQKGIETTSSPDRIDTSSISGKTSIPIYAIIICFCIIICIFTT